MGGFNRSKYKPTPMAAIAAQDSEHETKRPSNNFERPGYLTIDDGENKFRLFPCHPDGGGKTYSEAKCVSWLTVEKQVYENGKAIEGKKELKRGPIFNSKVHGNLKFDLVEEYMSIAKTKAIPTYTDDQKHQEKIWKLISDGMTGIKPSDSWVVYASKFKGGVWGPIGLLEFKASVKNQLKDKAIELIGDNPITPDPYTDPDEGIAVIITKTGKRLDTEYKVSLEMTVEGRTMKFLNTPITDEQGEAFAKLDPLYKIYNNVFKRKDLLFQIEGLMNYEQDLANKTFKDKDQNSFTANIGVFQYEEFQATMDKLLDLFPEGEEKGVDGGTVDDTEEVEHEEEIKEPIKINKPITRTVAPKQEVKKTVAAPVAPKVEEKPAHVNAAPTMTLQQRMAKIKAGLGK